MSGSNQVGSVWRRETALAGWLPARPVLCLLVFMSWLSSSQAILFYNTSDPAYNTNAPSGSLAESGWQYQGQWSVYLGTSIAPRYFVSAKHIGGAVGDPYVVDGVTYLTTAVFEHPKADLLIWRVRGSLPRYAELYTRTNETGRALVVFGRGSQRGNPVTINSLYNHPLKGWYWGPSDTIQRWGQNRWRPPSTTRPRMRTRSR